MGRTTTGGGAATTYAGRAWATGPQGQQPCASAFADARKVAALRNSNGRGRIARSGNKAAASAAMYPEQRRPGVSRQELSLATVNDMPRAAFGASALDALRAPGG